MLRNQLELMDRLLLLLILLLVKKIRDLLVVLQIQDPVLQLENLIALQNKDKVLLLVVHQVVLQTQGPAHRPMALQIQDLVLLVAHKIKDPVLLLLVLQIQDLVLHLGHLITLKIQDQVPLPDHPIVLQTNQIKTKILIPKVQIKILLKDKILIKIAKQKNKKH